MNVSEVLNYIPKEELSRLSLEYKVDYQVKKLDGQTMFQLLLFSMLNVKQNSLRVMEHFYHSLVFKNIANQSFDGVKYNSLRDRLVTINPDIPVVVDVQNFKKTTLSKRPFKIGLIHELAHAYDYKKKISSRKEWFSLDIDGDGIIDSSVTFEEQYASSIENIYRGKFGQSLRNYYINGVESSLLINNLLQTIWTDAKGNKKACDCGN